MQFQQLRWMCTDAPPGADRHTPGRHVAEGQANQPGGGWFEEPTPEEVLVRFEMQDALAGWHFGDGNT